MTLAHHLNEVWPRFVAEGVSIKLVPALAAIVGFGLIALFAVQAFRSAGSRARRTRPTTMLTPPPVRAPPPAPVAKAQPPAPPVNLRRAPVAIEFPQIQGEFPDVWGVGEPLDVVFRLEDKTLAALRQVPGLRVQLNGETFQPVFTRGVATVRRVFPSVGERSLVADLQLKNEPHPRQTRRTVRIVEYRTEIADVFTSFRQEASQAITPIREDATPWEIYDLLTSANPNVPGNLLREIVSSFEEAKYSNHPVTRSTYERMITALLQLERVEL